MKFLSLYQPTVKSAKMEGAALKVGDLLSLSIRQYPDGNGGQQVQIKPSIIAKRSDGRKISKSSPVQIVLTYGEGEEITLIQADTHMLHPRHQVDLVAVDRFFGDNLVAKGTVKEIVEL